MKAVIIHALLSQCVIVKATWWAVAARPVILGLGTLLTALNLEVLEDVKPI